MATRQAAVSNNLQLQLDGQWHKLSVTVRHDVGVEQGQLVSLVKSTVGLWCKAWQAVNAPEPMRDFNMQSACFQHEIEPCAGDPYVTVWNMGNGISLTVHSHTDGAGAVKPFFAYQDALDAMIEVKPEMFSLSQPSQASAPDNIRQLPQQAPANVSLNPFIRSTQAPFKVSGQVIPNTVGIEGGKTDNPNWNKPGMLVKDNYDAPKQYDKGQILLYTLTDGVNVRIKQPKDNMLIEFQTQQGSIAIWEREDTVYEGKTIKSDWNQALNKLGLDKVYVGQEFALPATYIAMKASEPKEKDDGSEVQYKNFYGFFNAPEQAELQATGTEGAPQATDSTGKEWLDQKIADMESPFPPASADVGDGDNIPF